MIPFRKVFRQTETLHAWGTNEQKTIAVLAALGAFALVGAMATFIWLERRKKKAEIEVSLEGLRITIVCAN